MAGPHPLLLLYRAAWRVAQPFAPWFLRRRLAQGKEDAGRLAERRGIAGLARPDGRLVWMHGASVGEALALLPLVHRVQAQGFHVLVTTGTVSSAQVMAQRLPPGALHQYAPLDAAAYMRRFLGTWNPSLILLAESELWPNLLLEARRRAIPVALVNARMSARSCQRWGRARGLINALLSGVTLCLAQSRQDAQRLASLGAQNVAVTGNLKFDAAPLPADAAALDALRQAIGHRPLWIAASTHDGEEAVALAAHKAVAVIFPNFLTILAPRHAARGAAIAQLAAASRLPITRRSQGGRIEARTQIYLCDTIGELGLLYRLGAPVFLGRSLTASTALGGQNPIEPAKLGCAILHGPHVSSFTEVYRLLDDANGAVRVDNAEALARELATLTASPGARQSLAQRAAAAVNTQAGAADATMRALAPLLARAP